MMASLNYQFGSQLTRRSAEKQCNACRDPESTWACCACAIKVKLGGVT